jgi:hypothetical protein
MTHRLSKYPWLLQAIPYIFILIGVLLVMLSLTANRRTTLRSQDITIENNTYNRIMTCIASVTPTERTADYVKFCYEEAEKHNDVTVTRFGNGK